MSLSNIIMYCCVIYGYYYSFSAVRAVLIIPVFYVLLVSCLFEGMSTKRMLMLILKRINMGTKRLLRGNVPI